MTRYSAIFVIVFFLLAMVVGGYLTLRGSKSPRPNVLWITMDSLRADHLGCTGYRRAHTPNIDALAHQGALFTQALAQASYTRISVPSMITGKYPFFLGVRMMHGNLDSSHVTLAEALAAEGYFTYGILEPWPEGFYQGLEKLDKDNSSTEHKTQCCLEALDQLDGRPFFIWLYYWDPHAPYAPPEEFMGTLEPEEIPAEQQGHKGSARFESADISRVSTGFGGGPILLLLQLNRGKTVLTPAEKKHLLSLYDAEIAFVDSKIKQVVDKLKGLELWEDTMVILNADHGEAFGEHGRYYHSHTLYEEEVRVPLMVKPPRSRISSKMVEGPVRNLDIMPTILDYCGIPAPEKIQGKSLRPFIEGDLSPNLPACIETHSSQTKSHLMAYRDGRHKLIYNLSHGGAELYDLMTDPDERSNLLAEGGTPEGLQSPTTQLETRLREKLLKTLGVKAISALELGEMPAPMDPETMEQLKALGYIY